MILLDKIIWVFLAVFFLSGWLRGFLKSLIGPIAFFCCIIAAVIFYDLNHNVLMAAVITFAGTIALSLFLSVLLSVTMHAINKEYRGKVFLLSRILGATVNVAWQANILFIGLIIFSIIPLQKGTLTKLQQQVPDSTMMEYYRTKIVDKDTRYKALIATMEVVKEPKEMQAIQQTRRYIAFQEDPNVQAFAADPDAILALQENNTIKLLQTPSLKKLVTSDSSMFTFTKLVESIYLRELDQLTGVDTSLPQR